MSGNNEKREQAQKLLRSFTDIDDRFLEEAMKEPETVAGAPETGTTASPGKAAPSAGRKLRRYSTWALTAAACLTVVIIGRYVTLNRNAGLKNEQPVEVSDEIKDTEVLEAAGEAKDQDAAEVGDDAKLQEAVGEVDMAEEADEAAPVEIAGEAAAEAPGEAMNAEPMGAAEAVGEAKLQEAAGEVDEAEEADEIYDAASAEREEADMESGMQYESAQLANPFTDTDTLEEAQEIAGFEMEVPAAVSPYTAISYRAIEGEMLEIIFSDRNGEEGYRIRKAAGEDDISGDYNEYAKEKTVRLSDGTKVTLRGDKEDAWSVAVWTADAEDEESAYSFAICSGEKTFTAGQIKKMAETMMQS